MIPGMVGSHWPEWLDSWWCRACMLESFPAVGLHMQPGSYIRTMSQDEMVELLLQFRARSLSGVVWSCEETASRHPLQWAARSSEARPRKARRQALGQKVPALFGAWLQGADKCLLCNREAPPADPAHSSTARAAAQGSAQLSD